LVSAAGARVTKSETKADVAWIEWKHSHTFHLSARVFDTTSKASVCGASHTEQDYSGVFVAFFYFMLPIPGVRPLNESGYWTRVSWYTGQKVGGCFVQPDEKN
jgi:hypothetical protein